MSKLIFEAPTPQTPGYLKRLKKSLEFRAKLKDFDVSDSAWIDKMVDFLVNFITEPEDKEEAKESLWDATEEQYNNMIDAIIGKQEEDGDGEEGDGNPTVDGKPSTKSEPLEKDKKQ